MKKIAVICADGLGDGLLSMVFAQNLEPHYEVTTFSHYLAELRMWFPHKKIEPLPKKEEVDIILSPFDRIISTDGAFIFREKAKYNLGEKYHCYPECDLDPNKTVLLNFLDICQKDFGIDQITDYNGLVIPAESLQFRRYPKRIIIHPTSTHASKNWLAKKYIKLAEKLTRKGFEPIFMMSPAERSSWETILLNKFATPSFPSLHEVAKFIYESGFMIGNDSGIGHLAANLGLPTLSLFSRLSVAKKWRPNWNRGHVVTPTYQLPGARLRSRYWQYFLTVNKVMANFKEMSKRYESL